MPLTDKDIAAARDPRKLSPYRARRLATYGLTDGENYTVLGRAVAATSYNGPRFTSAVHILALLKNAIEGPDDPFRHFGATQTIGGPGGHEDNAVQCQLLTTNGDPPPEDPAVLIPTGIGRDLYKRFSIGDLPEGRANHWRISHELETVLALLAGQ